MPVAIQVTGTNYFIFEFDTEPFKTSDKILRTGHLIFTNAIKTLIKKTDVELLFADDSEQLLSTTSTLYIITRNQQSVGPTTSKLTFIVASLLMRLGHVGYQSGQMVVYINRSFSLK